MSVLAGAAVGILTVGALAAAVVAGRTVWERRDHPGSRSLLVLVAATGWWTLFYGLEVLAPGLQAKLLFANIQWAGVMLLPVAWVTFALVYTGRGAYVRPATLALLGVLPVVTWTVVLTNGHGHHLLRSDPHVAQVDGLRLLVQAWGPWFDVALGFQYAANLVGTVLLVHLGVTSDRVYAHQAAAFLAAGALPAVVSGLSRSGVLGLQEFAPTPFVFVGSALLLLAGTHWFDALSVAPVRRGFARASVVEEIEDPVLVVDASGRTVDANPAAEALLGADGGGQRLSDVLPEVGPDDDPDAVETVTVDTHRGTRYFDVSASTMTDATDHPRGDVVVLRDVTARRTHRQRLDVLNRVLRHNLRNEMNVVMSSASYLEQYEPDDVSMVENIVERAREMVELGDKARRVETVLEREGAGTETVSLAATVDRIVERVETRYPSTPVAVDGPADGVRCDPLVEALLENLVENAVEHGSTTPRSQAPEDAVEHGSNQRSSESDATAATDGDAPVTVTAGQVGDDIRLVVADDGPGMNEQDRRVLTSDRETPLDHGSGVGLWLVNWCLQRLGGDVAVSSGSDGTTVEVEFPLTPGGGDTSRGGEDPAVPGDTDRTAAGTGLDDSAVGKGAPGKHDAASGDR